MRGMWRHSCVSIAAILALLLSGVAVGDAGGATPEARSSAAAMVETRPSSDATAETRPSRGTLAKSPAVATTMVESRSPAFATLAKRRAAATSEFRSAAATAETRSPSLGISRFAAESTTVAGAVTPRAPSPRSGLQDEEPATAFGPEIEAGTPSVEWGPELDDNVRFVWSVSLRNPNDRAVLVRVRLKFLNEAGEVLSEDFVATSLGPGVSRELSQQGSLPVETVERVVEARAEPVSWWADEPYKIRTFYTFLTSLRTIEILFVLEDWLGNPVEAPGIADIYVMEIEELRADVAGAEGAMRRRMKQLYARRFYVEPRHYENRQIGFLTAEYEPPTVTLGPLHVSVFDEEPRGHQGLVRLVFRTQRGLELVAEDRVYF